jgi:hypothetical protein
MAYVPHKLSALVIADPKKARQILLAAFVKHRGHRGNAAASLGIHVHTFDRMVRKLCLSEDLDELERKAIEEGRHHGANTPMRLGRLDKKRGAGG